MGKVKFDVLVHTVHYSGGGDERQTVIVNFNAAPNNPTINDKLRVQLFLQRANTRNTHHYGTTLPDTGVFLIDVIIARLIEG